MLLERPLLLTERLLQETFTQIYEFCKFYVQSNKLRLNAKPFVYFVLISKAFDTLLKKCVESSTSMPLNEATLNRQYNYR